jgi:hypothetical protein
VVADALAVSRSKLAQCGGVRDGEEVPFSIVQLFGGGYPHDTTFHEDNKGTTHQGAVLLADGLHHGFWRELVSKRNSMTNMTKRLPGPVLNFSDAL